MTSTRPSDRPEPAADPAPSSTWEADPPPVVRPDHSLLIDIDGFAGPLDLLLALARLHKIDLARIPIVALVEQYLAFIDETRRVNLEIAGDYLVMAAWLAFLKSRLLLPKEKTAAGELSGEEMAARLAFRLQRLDAMRQAAARLMTRKRLGIEVFERGRPEPTKSVREITYGAGIYDLLKAYAVQRIRTIKQVHVVKRRTVWSIKDARRRLEVLVCASSGDWVQLDLFLDQYAPGRAMPAETAAGSGEPPAAPQQALDRTVLAASFGASLEMAREGLVELKQDVAFGPIWLRRRDAGGAGSDGAVGRRATRGDG